MQFLGIQWDTKTDQPHWLVSEDDAYFQHIQPGDRIGMEISRPRLCIGQYSARKQSMIPCPYEAEVEDEKQCSPCQYKQRTYTRGIDQLDDEQKNTLARQSHIGYVNLFGGGKRKTGVTVEHRKYQRVLEQGAFATLYFASTDGLYARYIEDAVSETLQVAQHIQWKPKIETLNQFPSDYEQQLTEIRDRIYTHVPLMDTSHVSPMFDIHTWQDRYPLQTITAPDTVYYVRKLAAGDILAGTFYGVYGKLLCIQDTRRMYLINTDSLAGYTIHETQTTSASYLQTPSKAISFKKETQAMI